jgi:hypothetical protein
MIQIGGRRPYQKKVTVQGANKNGLQVIKHYLLRLTFYPHQTTALTLLGKRAVLGKPRPIGLTLNST